MERVHDLGIVHRDIKPQNIMIVDDPSVARGRRVKVLDFGIAKIINDAASDTGSLSVFTGGYMGTAAYSSPEQLGLELDGQEAVTVDRRSDIYSLGVLLYEMLAGARPFSGHPTKLMYDHAHTPPPAFAELAPGAGVPAAVEAVVRRCLEKNPANRPQSARELFESFREATEKSGVPWKLKLPVSWRQAVAGLIAASVLIVVLGWTIGLRHPGRGPQPEPPIIVTPSRVADRGTTGPGHEIKVPEGVITWLREHNLEPVKGTELAGKWPKEVKRKDRANLTLILEGSYYLPKGYEADSPSKTGEKTGLPKVLISGSDNARRFILIEGDEFRMGDFMGPSQPDKQVGFDPDEQPGHQVILSSFYIQETEVTIKEFSAFCRDTRRGENDPEVKKFFESWTALAERRRQEKNKLLDHPATGVDHRMAVKFAQSSLGASRCQRLNLREFAACSRREASTLCLGQLPENLWSE